MFQDSPLVAEISVDIAASPEHIKLTRPMVSVTRATYTTSTAYSKTSIPACMDQVSNHSKKIKESPVQPCWSIYMAVKASAAKGFVKIYSLRQLQAWKRYMALPLYIMIRVPETY